MRGPVVLILRALGLGDGLTGVAALRGLRRAFGPDARLVLAAPAGIGGWLVDRGVVDEVLPTPDLDDVVTSWRAVHGAASPEVAVDLHGRGPRSHRLLQQLTPGRLIAWRCPAAGHDEAPEHLDTEHEVRRWCRLVTSTTGAACGPDDLFLPRPGAARPPPAEPPLEGHVLVHPGAASGSRRWPAQRFAEVVLALIAAGHHVVLTGSADERELVAAVAGDAPRPAGGGGVAGGDGGPVGGGGAPAGEVRVLAGELDLDGLAAVVARARLVICGDTGVAHLATAYRVPSVLLFGPTPPAEWGPCVDLDRHRVLWHGPRFAGGDGSGTGSAGYRGDPHGRAVDPALDAIGVEEVLAAIAALAAIAEVAALTEVAAIVEVASAREPGDRRRPADHGR